MAKSADMTWRAVTVGGVVAVLGPVFGFTAIVAWVILDRSGNTALYLLHFPDVVTTPYLLGGGPAAVAGLVAGWRIWRCGAISMCFWLVATVIFALVPGLLYLALRTPPSNGIAYVSDREIAAAYVGAVAFASLVLHRLLSVSGLLHGERPR